MDEAGSIDRWNHTASVLALLANIHRNEEEAPQPFSARYFHPHYSADEDEEDDTDFDAVDYLERNGF